MRGHFRKMYGKCGSIADAKSTFDAMERTNVFSWNIMIAAYAQNGHYKEAIVLFWEMRCPPSRITFINVLTACAGLGDLAELEAVHQRIVDSCSEMALETEVVLGTALVNTYSKCGSLEAATRVFQRMRARDGVCFNAMIAAAAQHGDFSLALGFFRMMQLEGVRETSATLLGFAAVCMDLDVAKNIHERARGIGLDTDLATMNSLITMYGNCGSSERSWAIFSSMDIKDVISWNAMIGSFSQCGEFQRAMELSRAMDLEGVRFVDVTFVLVLGACGLNDESPRDRELLHDRVMDSGYQDNPVVGSALLSMHGRSGELDRAVEVFDRLRDPGLATYNAMLTQYVQHGRAMEALDLFKRMKRSAMKPNKVTLINLVEACSELESLEDGREIHRWIAALELESDLVVGTLLVNMYGSCGSTDDARSSFAKIKLVGRTEEVSAWNAMAGALAQNDCPREAMGVLPRMDCQGVRADEVSFISLLGACEDLQAGTQLHDRAVACGFDRDIVVATAIVSMYSRLGAVEKALEVFQGIRERDLVAWNAIVSGFAQQGHLEESIRLVRCMEIEGMRPNETVMATLAGSCQSSTHAYKLYRFISSCYMEEMDCYEWIGVAMIHMFAKAGCLSDARAVFDSMAKKGVSLAAWNSMLGAYAQTGHDRHRHNQALLFFTEMAQLGVDPDGTTFVCLLNSLTHSGLLARSRDCFVDMVGEFQIAATSEHYGCVIDLLGRCGRLRQAEELMNTMPFVPDSMDWTSLLSASTTHSDRGIAEQSASIAAALDPANSAPYVLLSNVIRHRRS
ncbi:pentatricopeptide repeat-containing protein At4g13650-like [Selaginella moellendorffii]|uniref:pentatricopeptide repeat-containing protein At4g13650-like n=1 Tax=Selaginella moellendorffii TaxID=88036 RepID=UPI000D1CEB92|nr:pentatricopeptide repeat-containing protein At4g13650-like [Selaginella moellendorffii]|eukprot:XP_024521263.1 pentatricopeptide repeat-containing protein At4g13650-like [Selaginella moellendorffii]